jgi:hypothetical protein
MIICNPSIQSKAQRIVDEAFGGERLPEISDRGRADLVYIEALLTELYRYASPFLFRTTNMIHTLSFFQVDGNSTFR